MTHNNYTVRELVNDQSFRRMVKGTADPAEIKVWSNWIEESDQNRATAKTAVSEIIGFKFDDPSFPDIEAQWAGVYAKTQGRERARSQFVRNNGAALNWMFRVAAVLFLAALVGLGVYNLSGEVESQTQLIQINQERTITTTDGEEKTLRFSNGSRIILNSNSTLTYSLGLLHNQTIDVTLEGEAYFDAESDPSQKHPVFAVNTPDGIIRDIGTEFLVTVQQEKSIVVLQEGLVEVEPANRENSKSGMFNVQRGEMVEFSGENILKRERVNPTLYTSWATEFMELDRTELREFADYVEQQFDVQVQIEDPDLAGITLTGAVYFKSLEGLVRSVSKVTGIPVYQSTDRATVYIGNPNE